MFFTELFTESLTTLTLNKIRTGLAMLGVIIGIGSVIALISLGQSSQRSITESIQSLGSNLLSISPNFQNVSGVRQGQVVTLTYQDAKAISESPEITTVKNVSAEFSRNAQIVAGRNNANFEVIGVLPEYKEIRNIALSSGSFISQRNIDAMAKVAVLGPNAVTELFGEGANPLNQMIRINGQVFNVVGVTQTKGGTGFQNPDDSLYIPLTTAQKLLFGASYVNSISVEAVDEKSMNLAKEQIANLLLKRHKIASPEMADFRIFSQEDLLSTVSSVTGTFTALLSGIAAISLVVGGIGIMNIMLVTVTERTREIGLRKALGAKRKIVTYQFLMEAVAITFIGGFIGIVLGITISYILASVLKLPFMVAVSSILLAFAVSAGVGVLFGWYPAQKASNLQPIEALRYE